jgi:hypothetical protein
VNWFRRITGFDEEDYARTQAMLRIADGKLVTQNKERYSVGTLEVPTLADLRSRCVAGGKLSKMEIVTGDVRTLHAKPESRGALFQVASQFNLLEMVSQHVTPEHGVTRYEGDRTQGPACAMAAGAATIYRNYLVPVGGGTGQRRDRQIDCLADLGTALGNQDEELWRMENGYAMFSESGLSKVDEKLSNLTDAALDDLKSMLRIGLQWEADVTDVQPGHAVSQAFCSALPIGYHHGLTTDPRWERIARLVLEAAYESTLLAAKINGSRGGTTTVYLTRIGGGVFSNPLSWINDAIRYAHSKVPGVAVRIVSHGAPDQTLRAIVS